MADEKPLEFEVPVNFAEEGTMLGGRVKSRNLLETALLFILLLQPILALQTGSRVKIYLAILFVLPVCLLSLIGIQGESLSAFFMAALYFYRTRRVWGRPDGREKMERDYRERRRMDAQKGTFCRMGKRKDTMGTESKTAARK